MARLEPGEFERIYDEHSFAVFNAARCLCGDDHAADVTQETFLRLWRRPDIFDPTRGSMRGFLLMTARSVAIDALRSRTARQRRELRVHHRATDVPTHAEPGERLLVDELVDDMARAVATLSPPKQQAIHAIFYDERTYRESAHALKVPVGTVKSRIHLAVRHLRLALLDQTTPTVDGRTDQPETR